MTVSRLFGASRSALRENERPEAVRVLAAAFGAPDAHVGAALFSACACYSQKNTLNTDHKDVILWM